MKTQVIIAAAGTGTRFKSRQVKPLILLDNRPLFIYCLEVFDSHQEYRKHLIDQHVGKEIKWRRPIQEEYP